MADILGTLFMGLMLALGGIATLFMALVILGPPILFLYLLVV